jgi:hypothetical protein
MAKLNRFIMLRVSERDAEAITDLKDRWGVSRGDVLRMLLRDAASRSGGRPPVLETDAPPVRGHTGGMNDERKDLGD